MKNKTLRGATGLYLMLDELTTGLRAESQTADLLGAISAALKDAVDQALRESETPITEPVALPADPPVDPARAL